MEEYHDSYSEPNLEELVVGVRESVFKFAEQMPNNIPYRISNGKDFHFEINPFLNGEFIHTYVEIYYEDMTLTMNFARFDVSRLKN